MSPNTEHEKWAEAKCRELLGLPEGARKIEFARLMDEDEALATLVHKKMDECRAKARG